MKIVIGCDHAATELKATYEKDGKEVPEYITKVLEIAG